ncbi:SGNH/GDSL hydrolase family protein [Methylorubrum sp. POS3]|uniref:SGNH/GDSL hydrolase family protein n=1 Tax=Methylorubrum sp. POS3 TaxID=2998492 RepID=UPI00372B5A91
MRKILNLLCILHLLIVFVMMLVSKATLAKDAPLRVVAFGTSLTARGGWQDALAQTLERCGGRAVTVETIARVGATSRWALEAVADVVARRPDIVLVEFAVNDAALNRLMLPSQSESNLRRIVAVLKSGSPPPRIVLMAMNPVIGLRGAIRPFLDRYYDINARIAESEGLMFVDHRPSWKKLSASELASALPDGSHPRPETASRLIVPALGAALFPDCRE